MFVWQARALLERLRRFAPDNDEPLQRVIEAWGTDAWPQTVRELYPSLHKISVDYAIMEPASADERTQVAAVPMPVQWLDVGSWPAFGETRERDAAGNVVAGCRHVGIETSNTLAVGDDPEHLVATIGVDNLIIVRTERATLVCRADMAEQIKALHKRIAEDYGGDYV